MIIISFLFANENESCNRAGRHGPKAVLYPYVTFPKKMGCRPSLGIAATGIGPARQKTRLFTEAIMPESVQSLTD
jgi:hypothetical protein